MIEDFRPRIEPEVVDDLRERLGRTRWPGQPEGLGWELGVDLAYLRELCEYWERDYDFERLEQILGEHPNKRWNGIHFLHARASADAPSSLPIMLVHGWPGGVIEFSKLIPLLTAAGHDVVAPSLPGYGFSDELEPPPNAAGVAEVLGDLMDELGYERYALQGGDWGAPITFGLAHQRPEHVAALHLNAVSVLPAPADLADPPLTEAEQEFIQTGLKWRSRQGHHLLLHGAAPDSVSTAFSDSPAGLAGWLVEKYRKWSDCATSMAEFIALARQRPGQMNYLNTGNGSSMHLNTELLKLRQGIDLVSVPYKGMAPAIADLLNGHLQFGFTTPSLVLQHIQAGRLRALAVGDPVRHPALPGVPTLAELGLSDVQLESWFVLTAPAATPPAILNRLNASANRVLQNPDLRQRLDTASLTVLPPLSPSEVQAMLARDHDRYRRLIEQAGIKPDP